MFASWQYKIGILVHIFYNLKATITTTNYMNRHQFFRTMKKEEHITCSNGGMWSHNSLGNKYLETGKKNQESWKTSFILFMLPKGQPVGLWIMYWNYQVNWNRFISEAAGFMVNHIPNPKFFSSLLRKSHLEPNHEKVPGLFKAGLNLCATFCLLGPSLTIVSSTQHS